MNFGLKNIMIQHIMVPYDDSEPAAKAFEFSLDLAKKYGAKTTIIAYVPQNFDFSGDGMSYTETTRLLRQSAGDSLVKLEPKLQKTGIPYEIKVVEGTSITHTLLSYAESHHVDLIIMGSRGLGGFKKLLLGSVASGISQHSECPVLIVK